MSTTMPGWAQELSTLLPACAHYLLSGNTDDLYLVGGSLVNGAGNLGGDTGTPPVSAVSTDTPRGPDQLLLPLTDVIQVVLAQRGIPFLVTYDITSGTCVLPPTPQAAEAAESVLGRLRTTPAGSLTGLADLVQAVTDAPSPVGLLVLSASRLARDLHNLSDPEFGFYRRVDRTARAARPGANQLYNPVIWVLQREQDMPPWLATGNERLRPLVVPVPDTGDRRTAAERFLQQLPPVPGTGDGPDSGPNPAAVLTENTAGLSLVTMESIVGLARDQGLGRDRLEDAARAYRVGILENPWRRSYLVSRLKEELDLLDQRGRDAGTLAGRRDEEPHAGGDSGNSNGRLPLVDRVLGQDHAVRRSLDILVRSVTSLTAAHSPKASRPRGVLFLAGPTGVGKTELAKGLTRLLFDDESLYVRFDMSEFSSEHAADRLIGAPPGYVGYERGGELTNAVRRQPFSLVLFDEIEKAEPRVLDKFLQLLDDGRLTDGRGETVHFTETVIVFTSNLGIFRDVVKTDEEGNKYPDRERVVDPGKHSPSEVDQMVRKGIEGHFTLRLGRPELLNRIGSDNIVVFDFIRPETGGRILDQMVANVLARVRAEHHLDLTVSDGARSMLADECLRRDEQLMGGRGISARVETVLVNPLAKAVFQNRDQLGDRADLVDLDPGEGETWHAVLKAR